MKKTVLIDLYGGPGTGKSTFAAQLFSWFKTNSSLSVELIPEVAKDFAWVRAPIHQPDIFFEQSRRVDRLMGVVDVLITDSPLGLQAYYGRGRWVELVSFMYELWRREHEVHSLFLTRTKKYDPRGRYQTEDEARAADVGIKEFFEKNLHSITHQGSSEEILEWISSRFGKVAA